MRMFNPPHPGLIIKEFWVDDLNISIRDLAKHLDVSPSTINRIINGKSDISPEMALRLSRVLGRSPESWLDMQNSYNLWEISQEKNFNELIPILS